jgi:hypothetical protein
MGFCKLFNQHEVALINFILYFSICWDDPATIIWSFSMLIQFEKKRKFKVNGFQ